MFGVSFSELVLVGLVALLVLGPERLPGAARTAGLWIGRIKRSFNAIKQEVEREIGADEIRRQLHNEHILSLEQEARKIMTPLPQAPIAPSVAQPIAAVAPAAAETPSSSLSLDKQPTQQPEETPLMLSRTTPPAPPAPVPTPEKPPTP